MPTQLLFLITLGVATAADRHQPVPLTDELRQQCLSVLQEAFFSPEFWPSMHAAEALTLAGNGAEVIAALKPRIETEQDHQRRCGLVREVVRAGDRTPLKRLFETLADLSSNGRVHAAESLYKIAEVGDGRLLRTAFAQKENLRLRLMAAAALARAGNPHAVQVLREHVTHSDVEIRKIAGWVLGLLGGPDDAPALNKTLAAETDLLAQAYFVNALACLGDDAARRRLVENLSSTDPAIRTYSAEFAGYSRCLEARSKLIELLADDNVDVRTRAAQSLIAFSLQPSALQLPVAANNEEFSVDVYRATKVHPRYSEGSIVPLRNGSLLYAATEFAGGGADHSGATIVGRVSPDGGRTWGESRTLQENIGKQNVMSVTLRRMPPGNDAAPLGMFFLIKNSPTDLKVALRVSHDDAETFGEPVVVTPGPGYHVMNNDRVTNLDSGRLVCPVAWTDDVSRGGHFVSQCFLSDDGGKSWRAGTDRVDQPQRGAMEPEVVELDDGRLMMIVRTQLGIIATSYSSDGGDHWSTPGKLAVVAPESPATIRAIPGTGDLLLVWNNTFKPGAGHGGPRTPLAAAISRDAGQTWTLVRNLETDPKSGYAYTSVLFHKDRLLLSYYVSAADGTISSRFRSTPVRHFYVSP